MTFIGRGRSRRFLATGGCWFYTLWTHPKGQLLQAVMHFGCCRAMIVCSVNLAHFGSGLNCDIHWSGLGSGFCSCSQQWLLAESVCCGPLHRQNGPIPRASSMIPPSKHLAMWPHLFLKHSHCMPSERLSQKTAAALGI